MKHYRMIVGNSRVLIIGATGFIGRFITEASLHYSGGSSTYILIRSHPICPSKAEAIQFFKDKGALILHGAINDKEFMEKILKEHEIEIVISAVGGEDLQHQLVLLHAIKTVGTIKRFLPSEFGHDVDRSDPIEPGLTMYKHKRRIRREIEELGIAYTYICCNSIASWPYYHHIHPSKISPPLDQFQIYGDGSVKAYFVAGPDIGKFTIKAAHDIRGKNKIVHFRPECNFLNMNELASLWEKQIRRSLPRVTVSEDDLLLAAEEKIIPGSVVASLTHDIFIKGCQTNFSVDGPNEVEVTNLYPDEPFTTMEDCFQHFLLKLDHKVTGTKNLQDNFQQCALD